mgnify:CR=1 FL=1
MSYKIDNTEFTDLFSLAKIFYLHSDFFSRELRESKLFDFIEELDSSKAEKIKKLSLLSLPDDVFVFKSSYILNPYMDLRIKGYRFKDYHDLGKAMLAYGPSTDQVLLELVRYGLLSQQMESSLFADDHREIYLRVKEIEEKSEEDSQFAYFSLGYYLSGNQTIIYKGIEYQNIYNLTYFLAKQEKDLDSLGAYLSFSPLFKAYSLFSKEDGKKVESYLHLCQELEKSSRSLQDFLEKNKEKNDNP